MLRLLACALILMGANAAAQDAPDVPEDYNAEAMLNLCNG